MSTRPSLNELARRLDGERFPMHPFPASWYVVATSAGFAPGALLRRGFAGREVVVFRTKAGVAAVFEAHCPHLGAHFGDGAVVGETLRCPMHHFDFATDGKCVAVGPGYCKVPSAARAGALPVREVSGVVLAWHHPDGYAPTWSPPELADPTWGRSLHRTVDLETHVQEIGENLFDLGHLAAVHKYRNVESVARPVFDGHTLQCVTRWERAGTVTTLTTKLHGLGLYVFDGVTTPGDIVMRLLFAPTPTSKDRVTLNVLQWIPDLDAVAKRIPGMRFLPLFVRERLVREAVMWTMLHDVEQDKRIFAGKRFLPRPALADADAAVPVYRRWARQFYPSGEAAPAPEAAGAVLVAAASTEVA